MPNILSKNNSVTMTSNSFFSNPNTKTHPLLDTPAHHNQQQVGQIKLLLQNIVFEIAIQTFEFLKVHHAGDKKFVFNFNLSGTPTLNQVETLPYLSTIKEIIEDKLANFMQIKSGSEDEKTIIFKLNVHKDALAHLNASLAELKAAFKAQFQKLPTYVPQYDLALASS